MVAGENECVVFVAVLRDVKLGVRGFDCWVLLNVRVAVQEDYCGQCDEEMRTKEKFVVGFCAHQQTTRNRHRD